MSDYIKREDAYKYLDEQLVEVFTGETLLGALKQIIAKLPSADAVEVRHGRWLKHYECCDAFVCSECGAPSIVVKKYCCECGAKMDGKEQEHE